MTSRHGRYMPAATVEGDHRRLHPTAGQTEQITGADLTVGCLQDPVKASVVIVRRLHLEHVPQGFFEGVGHGHLIKLSN